MNESSTLLEVRHLAVQFGTGLRAVRAVRDVSYRVERGEAVALVGESGSGKSVSAFAPGRLLQEPPARIVGGEAWWCGEPLLSRPEREVRALRGHAIGYVFQDPAASLNPVRTVRSQLLETLERLQQAGAADGALLALLRLAGLDDEERVAASYPHHLSGGMQQRVMLALALAGRPSLLVADEPTTALDVLVQARLLEQLSSLRREQGLALLLISHNLALVGRVTSQCYVLYAGAVMEAGPTGRLLRAPRHPYTAALLQAVPQLRSAGTRLEGIPGMPPRADEPVLGCPFHPRCPHAQAVCREHIPLWSSDNLHDGAACHFPL